ncbi:MAG TPA: PaaI family thioesterase [Candidatus Fraserbacteria bacterium]|nr:PaaI family thioesterase [Candidatus Fraserbacteria bacterium]
MEDRLTWGRQVLASQPFSVLLGAELLSFSDGSAELKVPIKAELKQQHGFVHGGVISYVADNALTYAGGGVLGSSVVTSEFKINYVRPAMGEFIVARATVIHAGKNQAVCRCEVYVSSQGTESLCAIAQGTITRLGQPSESQS